MEKSGPGRNHYLLYDEYCGAAAREYLQEYAYGDSDKPLCLVIGFCGPHCPFVCPEEEFARYWEAVEVQDYSSEYLAGRHPYSRRFAERAGINDLTEHERRRTRAAYYGMVDCVDQQVGSIVDTISKTGLADDSVVIYTSDHGELAGDHGLWWKMSFYEGSVGVPLIVSWPGHFPEGTRESMPVTLADVAPTLASIGGAKPIFGVSSPGFADVLQGVPGDSDRAVFSELIGDSIAARLPCGPSGGPARMMRKSGWKCNYYHDEPPELFHLDVDPEEMVNLADDPDCGTILEEMLAAILNNWDPENIAVKAKEQRQVMEYISAAPQDLEVLADEVWLGPKNYGFVRSV